MIMFRSIAAALLLCAAFALAGCGANTLHKPTTAGNAGTSALVAYAAGGFTAGKYLALPLCATPPAYPCKTQAVNDRVALADTAAYQAAVAADSASASAAEKAKAAADIAALKTLNASPEVKAQVDLKDKTGSTP